MSTVQLVSFSPYQLWQYWREPGPPLARRFTDYEPGIHWFQVQMQAGTTDINTPRIYNSVKPSLDQGPSGVFIRHWVKELGGDVGRAAGMRYATAPMRAGEAGAGLVNWRGTHIEGAPPYPASIEPTEDERPWSGLEPRSSSKGRRSRSTASSRGTSSQTILAGLRRSDAWTC